MKHDRRVLPQRRAAELILAMLAAASGCGVPRSQEPPQPAGREARKAAAPASRARRPWRRPAVALAGAVAVGLVVGFGLRAVLAPGPPGGAAVLAACARDAVPLGADQLRAAYQAPPATAGTATGAGTSIAVIIPSAAPHVTADLATYSRRYGLPAPRVQVLSYGHVSAPSGSDADGWQQEGTLDLELAHAMAPQARLLYLAVPGSGTIVEDQALGWLVARYRPTVVSFSEGVPEGSARPGLIASSRAGLQAAARAGTTVVAGSGDYGPAEPGAGGRLQRGVLWPASDPLATAVGGTRLTARAAGHGAYASAAYTDGSHAGGAGLSALFTRPAWQDGVRAVTGSRRGVADIAMDASACSPPRIYTSTNDLPGRHPGWGYVNGTSAAAPLFAGIVADAAGEAGHPLGVLGPALYRLHGTADGITDVTAGSDGVPGWAGYPARPGYDLPTGVGTVASITRFAQALARSAGPPASAARAAA